VWTFREHKSVVKTLAACLMQVIKKYEFWKNVARHGGPEGLRKIKGLHDEALKGALGGSRSSRLSDVSRATAKNLG